MMPASEDPRSQEMQDPAPGASIRPLTRQEIHVLDLLSQGYTNEDVARSLDIAVSTVSSHVQHILKKLRVRNRVEAVLYTRHYGILAEPPRAPRAVRTQRRTKAAKSGSLRSRDPLLFLCQLNHVNQYIALSGPLHIDYNGVSGDISLVFYDAYTQRVKVHLEPAAPGEMNIEVDEMLWRYILEAAEGESMMVFSFSPVPSSGQK
jgi:DNA-binding CsgD family transcriptional regulator